ncbi:ABC transporter permease [Candidatus Kuenenbacteria bacterium]|nr:ABC transporter permease [Candidatus Kuenenbacteria bacterium]
MLFLSSRRILTFSWQHFWRNIWLSLVTITIIVLTLFSLTTLILVNAIADYAVNSVKDTVDVSLYFDNAISEEAIKTLKQELDKIEELKEVQYITPEEALEQFKETHKDDADIQSALAELDKNPLGGTLVLSAHAIEQYPAVMEKLKELKADSLAEKIDYNDHQKLIERINNFTAKLRTFVLALSLVFILVAILTVFNTIRMGIYIHRTEIGIMRLVGASNWFIRLPFVIEGLLYAVFGCLVFWLVLAIALHFTGDWVNSFLAGINFDIRAYLNKNVLNILGFEFIIVAVINMISAAFAMGKHLKV